MKKRILCLFVIFALFSGYLLLPVMANTTESSAATQDKSNTEENENALLFNEPLVIAEKSPLWNTEDERIFVEKLNKDSAALLSTLQINATPYPSFEVSYSSSASTGTIRFISQVPGSSYFKSAYWPTHSFGYYSSPISECGTASVSMALSYIGVNKTPKEILEYDNGRTHITKDWGEAEYKTPDFNTAMSNYINGDGKYSPPIICLKPSPYSDNQHFVLVAGKVSATQYVIVDPGCNSQDTMTISGNDWSQYWGRKHTSGKIIGVYQYYNKDATGTHTPTPIPPNSPTSATLTINNSEYFIDENFTFTFSSDQPCDYYWLSIYDVDTDEAVIGTRVEGTNSYTNSFKKAGHYSAHMAAANQSGTADSNWVGFGYMAPLLLLKLRCPYPKLQYRSVKVSHLQIGWTHFMRPIICPSMRIILMSL